jgi:hypothetical protein
MILGQLYEEYENNPNPMYFVLNFMDNSLLGMVNIHK